MEVIASNAPYLGDVSGKSTMTRKDFRICQGATYSPIGASSPLCMISSIRSNHITSTFTIASVKSNICFTCVANTFSVNVALCAVWLLHRNTCYSASIGVSNMDQARLR